MTKFFIDQHGCAKNQTDGELIVSFLEKEGFQHTFNPDEADCIIINSCGFIESAKKESIDAIYNVKAGYPDAKIVLTGCLAERYAEQLKESIPELSGIFGNGNLSKIADFMKKIENPSETDKAYVEVYPQEEISFCQRSTLFNFKGSAFVKITEGCSNHCSFCAIPLIRGEVRSRPVESIIEEIKNLVAQGIYEINLIGQDLAAFEVMRNYETRSGLAQLLSEISKLDGDFVIRLLYIHPDHFNKDIIDVIKNDARFIHYFDIPFQSGDDDIIVAMNRVGPASKYVDLIKYLRSELSDCVIRTTFLTGFPGETDEAAENTQNFLKAIEPDWSGCFPFSREEDTPAYSMKNRVPAKVAKKRAEELELIQSEITQKRLQKYIGKEVSVLIEEIIENNEEISEDSTEGLAIGRGIFQAPEVDGCIVVRYDRDIEADANAVQVGNVVNVKILAVNGVDLDSSFVALKKEFPRNSEIKFI